MLRYLGVAEDDIDDLSQEVLLRAYTSLPRYDPAHPAWARGEASPAPPSPAPPSPPHSSAAHPAPRDPAGSSRPHGLGARWRSESTWLFGIAWRQVRHHLERAYRRREVPVGLADAACFEAADIAPSSEQRIATKERVAVAIRLLAKIPPERRAILILADAYDTPVHEIARALDLNENTAASRLRLAREDYRAAVKRLRPEEQQALRSGLLMLPLLSAASSRAAAAPRPAHAAAAAAETHAPATRPDVPSGPVQQELADPPGRVSRPPRLARPMRLVHALARSLRPALAWAIACLAGAAVVAALAPPRATWAERLGPLARALLVSHAVRAGAPPRREPVPGEAPRFESPRLGAIPDPDKEPSAARAPTPGPANVLAQHEPAAPRQHAPSGQEEEPLAEELRLLDAARQALLRGDRTTAMERIAAHERRFPQGRLKLMRERLRLKVDAPPASPAMVAAPAAVAAPTTLVAPAAPTTLAAPAAPTTPAVPASSATGQELP
ncbi:RNA polymerase subunit sigma [Sorangium cellulosum]|uniref:RNA polymerase subunit sigma n=2 Tax=Sorangium cellulosum TaxID=56 RepID=A0A150QZ79_SORCE|nr:RNA polymerase subunit sigma [Sorangium cellulosum]